MRHTVRATLDDLYRFEGKAELIAGEIVPMMATGFLPGRIAGRIFYSLEAYAEQTQKGYALGDNVGYAVKELHSGRQSFSPDVSFYTGRLPADLIRFIEGPPTFAVEIRSETEYSPMGEFDRAAKRADYFEAGTLAVWDVDTLGKAVHLYRASSPYQKESFAAGQTAHAEPVVPGWQIGVDRIFTI